MRGDSTKPILLTCLLLSSWPASAADHRDAPLISQTPAADLSDVFGWMSEDGQKLYLAMTVGGGSAPVMFSDAVQYVFHLRSQPSLDNRNRGIDHTLICIFDVAQNIECWIDRREHLSGDPRPESGLTAKSGQWRVFAGQRNDPFFFNAEGFNSALRQIKSAQSTLSFDAAGCPSLDSNTSAALVRQLATSAGGGAPSDGFSSSTILALVVEMDVALINDGGPLISVWASTRQ